MKIMILFCQLSNAFEFSPYGFYNNGELRNAEYAKLYGITELLCWLLILAANRKKKQAISDAKKQLKVIRCYNGNHQLTYSRRMETLNKACKEYIDCAKELYTA